MCGGGGGGRGAGGGGGGGGSAKQVNICDTFEITSIL